ncbi:MAG: ribose-phosphate pyrophosphokinase [Lachnospiraceae bacterium]|nr:ribose-phosphate pyrophosphokinase [Lachnospiraceae bacterium]
MASDLELHQLLDRSLPVAPLGLIVLPSAQKLGEEVNAYISKFRDDDLNKIMKSSSPAFEHYYMSDYRIKTNLERYDTGEGRAVIEDTCRGKDLYILCDVTNHSITYQMNGFTNHMSPDDHFQDLKRVISAVSGHARRISVIMPFLYEGRQHHRSGRESLDAANMLKELYDLRVDNFITFDAHDPRIASVEPIKDFSNFTTPYQFLHALIDSFPDLKVDREHTVVISPDEGATSRAVYFADVIGADMGMFYKRRDYTQIVGGKNPIVAHQFLGTDLEGKDAIVIDDMISTGGSILDTSKQLKEKMHAKRVFICTTFGLFNDGLSKFDAAYEKGHFDKVVTTNLTYQPEDLPSRPWFAQANMSKYLATIIEFINHDASITNVSTSTDKIHELLVKYNQKEQNEFEKMQIHQTQF